MIEHRSQNFGKEAVLVGTRTKGQSKAELSAQLDELAQLASSVGLRPIARFEQYLERLHNSTLIGKGKIDQIDSYLKTLSNAVLLFDDNLSPTQLRNLEKRLEVRIYDRSLLILETFLCRAQTAQARLQVNVARYEYLLPRLTRRWTHLERQRGGLGSRGGAGEKEIETDRRQIQKRITRLKKQLLQVEKQNRTQRKSRENTPRIALVGYTNAGKSTLMNALSRSKVEAEDKLFATLSTTVRRLQLDTTKCLLSDTVGFIDKLPHLLIESFRATLSEVTEADLLLHVADLSGNELEKQIRVVEETLQEIGIQNKPMILVLNKIDLCSSTSAEPGPTIWEKVEAISFLYPYVAHHYGSAQNNADVHKLKNLLCTEIEKICTTDSIS